MRARFDRTARWVFTWVGAAGVASATRAQADDAVPVTLEFSAPPGCPAAADFQRRVQSRTPHLRVAEPGEPARQVRAVVELTADGVRGSLVVVEIDGRTAERTLSAPDCRQAADALALVAALAIEGKTIAEPEPTAAPTPAPPLIVPVALPPIARAEAQVSPPERTQWAFDASVGGLGAAGVAPGTLVGFAVLAGAELTRLRPPWALLLSVGFVDALQRSFPGPNGTASFGVYSGLAEACPVAGRFFSRVTVRPCLAFEYGLLVASGADTVAPRSESRPWAALGLEGRLDVRLVGPLSVDAAVGLWAPVVRDRFVLGDASVFEVPDVASQATLGLAISLR